MKNLKVKIWMALLMGALSVSAGSLEKSFLTPPDSARPGVYWYFMDGNMDRELMEVDLQSMYDVGLRKALFLEVFIGVPRGPIKFMSEPWQDNFANAVKFADKLGIEIILGTGPGWSGSGGPWVKPEQSMQHLCASSVNVNTAGKTTLQLPVPAPMKPSRFAGMSKSLSAQRDQWYTDVAVLAFPTPMDTAAPDHLDVKALHKTDPYSIWKHVLRHVPSAAEYTEPSEASIIDPNQIIDLTDKMNPDGTLSWDVPPGNWTVMRFAARSTGQTTRPAPAPGHGFEVDKFDGDAYKFHFENFQKKLMDKVGPRRPNRGWTAIHLDSWEMSSQNWTQNFREAFKKQCGYDPQPFYPAYHGLMVGSRKQTERFLFDMRRVAQELLLNQHAQTIKDTAHENGFYYTSQGYDMNPAGDLDILSIADIPSCEFWINDVNDTVYSCVEAVSAAHTMGKPVVRAEAFTSVRGVFGVSPGDMKDQSNWAFAMGINDFIFHTFQHQPLGKEGPKPGMAMGPHGIHWHRNQTFWPMVGSYHDYVARCGEILRKGVSEVDVLYLTEEGAPHIFLAPKGALDATKDKHSYSFDAISPRMLIERAKVIDGKIVFDGGSSYRLLVLPRTETMTPELLRKIKELVDAGATIQGEPPVASPSLIGFPQCDAEVKALAKSIWGKDAIKPEKKFGLVSEASWIWYDKGNPAHSAPPETIYFSKTFNIKDIGLLKEAVAYVTADNSYKLSINGKEIMQGNDFRRIDSESVLSALHSGENKMSVVAINDGETPNPAGLMAAMRLVQKNGMSLSIVSDASWNASRDEKSWSGAKVLGKGTMSPWKLSADSSAKKERSYPNYSESIALLEKQGLPKIFSTDGNLRFHKRRTSEKDIFFVANRSAKPSACNGFFRTDGTNPELWNPIDGSTRPLPVFKKEANGVVQLPLEFAGHEGYFVVFDRKVAETKSSNGNNFPELESVKSIAGSWAVTFDPVWGGPEKAVTFESLTDWTTHAESGIKYYSGIAVYELTFDYADQPIPTIGFLDLGRVEDVARVTLNGQALGTVWSAPYRVAIPKGVLKKKGNQLKVEVANTWNNRLAGDQQPKDNNARELQWKNGLLEGKAYKTGRFTFTTDKKRGGDVKANTPLTPSGLLGPVRILEPEGLKW